jgi:hypothetical protein
MISNMRSVATKVCRMKWFSLINVPNCADVMPESVTHDISCPALSCASKTWAAPTHNKPVPYACVIRPEPVLMRMPSFAASHEVLNMLTSRLSERSIILSSRPKIFHDGNPVKGFDPMGVKGSATALRS